MDFPDIFKGTPTPAKWAALGEYLRDGEISCGPGLRLRRVGNKSLITARRFKGAIGGGGGGMGPYHVNLVNIAEADAPPVWAVTVTPGYVCERIPGAATSDALAYHLAVNHWDETDPLLDPLPLQTFPIVPGEAVYIAVEVSADGTVGPSAGPVEILVDEEEKTSVHYQPKVDDQTSSGAAGSMYYKLAVLEGEAEAPRLKKYLSGSHIAHYQELPAMRTTLAAGEDIGVILQKWDADERCYKLRAIDTSEGELTAETAADAVSLRGNEVDGSLSITVEPGSPQIVEWKDGLITTAEDIVVVIPEPPDTPGGLPNGVYTGDLLVWNNEAEPPAWEVLTAPETPDTGKKIFIAHPGRGTAPEFLTLEEISTFICVAGVPTEFKIYGEEVE
jgi:hypothetical protein